METKILLMKNILFSFSRKSSNNVIFAYVRVKITQKQITFYVLYNKKHLFMLNVRNNNNNNDYYHKKTK